MKAVLLCLTVILFASGCDSQRELNELTITIGMGIDKGNPPDDVRLIAQIVKPSAMQSGTETSSTGGGGGGGGSSQNKSYYNLVSTGSNSFEAIREFTHIAGKIYQSHTQLFLIGKDVAEEGTEKYLDFFIRAAETRPLTYIVIADGTAEEALSVDSELEKLPSMAISKLIEAQKANSQSSDATIQHYINDQMSETASFIAPILRIRNNLDKKVFALSGLAVFKKDKMVGELSEKETRGCLWIRNEVKSGVINIPVGDGEIAIEIKSAKTSLKPTFVDGKPVMKISIKTSGTLGTQTSKEDLTTKDGLKQVEQLEKVAIEEEIRASFEKCYQLKADVFRFGEEFHNHYHKDWIEMYSTWDEIFPSIQIELDIKTTITAAGSITKPVRPPKGDVHKIQ